jgi:hypothetical protein
MHDLPEKASALTARETHRSPIATLTTRIVGFMRNLTVCRGTNHEDIRGNVLEYLFIKARHDAHVFLLVVAVVDYFDDYSLNEDWSEQRTNRGDTPKRDE